MYERDNVTVHFITGKKIIIYCMLFSIHSINIGYSFLSLINII